MTYAYAIEGRDYSRIDKLNTLSNRETFYDDVRKMCIRVQGDHAIKRWQALSEIRKAEIDEENKRRNAMKRVEILTVDDLAKYIVSRINLRSVLANPFSPVDFAVEFDPFCKDPDILKANATGWYGIRKVDTGFDSYNLCLVCDYYGGGCGSYVEIYDDEIEESAVIEIKNIIMKTLAFNCDSLRSDERLLVDFGKAFFRGWSLPSEEKQKAE